MFFEEFSGATLSQVPEKGIRALDRRNRFVYLPFEAHGYLGRENVLDVFAEQLEWFDKYVKNAGPREPAKAAPSSR